MLTNITFTQENGKMRISWLWESEIESIEIKFKKSEVSGDAGAPFCSGRILKYPGKGSASIERRIESEWGLYDFTFFPRLIGGKEADPIVYPSIMVGEKKCVSWNVEKQKNDFRIHFSGNNLPMPAEVVCAIYEINGTCFTYTIPYEITAKTDMAIPNAEYIRQFCVKAREPYDKAYCFVQSS